VRILIVDDNETNLYMMQALLEGHGFTVETARNGAEALEIAHRSAPTIVVADILMPVMDGFTLCREWQRDEQLRAVPFIFYTATYTDPKDEAFALSLGAARFVAKPVEPDVLLDIVRDVVAQATAGSQRLAGNSPQEEPVYLKAYSERLIHKLEDKSAQLERANRRLVSLYRASVELAAPQTPDGIIGRALGVLVEALGLGHGIYYSYDEAAGTFDVREAAGFPLDLIDRLRQRSAFRLGDESGLVGLVGQTRQPLIVDETRSDPRWAVIDGTIRSGLFVPVVHRDRLIGVLSLLSRANDFSAEDRPYAAVLAHNLSTAIENARLVEDLRQSEERFRRLAENVDDLIYRYRLAPTAGFDYVSPAATALTGYTPEEHYADPELGFKLVHPDDRPLLEAYRQGEGRIRDPLVLRWRRKDGTLIWTEQRNAPVTDETGALVALEGIARDITARKQAEESIRRLSQFQERVIENASIWLDVLDGHANVVIWNQAAHAISGYSREEVVGHDRVWEWLYPDEAYRNKILARAQAIIREGETVADFETTIRRKDGQERVISWDSQALVGDAGEPLGSIALGRDVTRRKAAEEALAQHAQRLEALHTIDQAILAAQSPEEIARAALGHIRRLAPCSVAGIGRYDPAGGDVVVFAVHAEDDRGLRPSLRFPLLGIEDVMEALQRGEVAVESDVAALRNPPPAASALLAAGLRSFVAAPLAAAGELTAILGLASSEPQAFTPAAITVVREVADQLAVALHQADLRAALQAEREKLAITIEHLPEGILLLDGDCRVTLANPAARALLPALADSELPVGDHPGGVLTHLAGQSLDQLASETLAAVWRELEITTPLRRTFQVAVRPIALAAGGAGRLIVIQDATELRQIQERVEQQERLSAIGQLAGGIAHDFNNLLSAIMLYAQLSLHKPGMPSDAIRAFEVIIGESRRAADLVQQILDFSRRATIETRAMDMGAFIREAVRLLERTIPESISLRVQVEPGDHVIVADPTRIQQVLMNLVVNARDVMPAGGRLDIRVRSLELATDDPAPVPEMAAGRWVCLTVADTGPGIPPEVLAHIFEPFFTTKSRGQGTGLGLAQVHGIVSQHGGYCDVETAPGAGAAFHIFLPACSTDEAASQPSPSAHAPEGEGETILVVEDNERLRNATRDLLELLGYRVVTAPNGSEALDRVRAGPRFDLVLTDVVMPEMSAEELIRTLKGIDPDLRVLAMSGYVVEDERRALEAAGAIDVLTKPLTVDTLSEAIGRALR